MCVIIAAKVYLKNSDVDKWFLFKNRDRAYTPNYEVHYKEKEGIGCVFVTDQDNDWSEGVNSNGLMIVNTALQNFDDKKDDGEADDLPAYDSGAGKILRNAFSQKSVDGAVKVIVDGLLDGNTFVSDGEKMVAIEIFLKREVDERVMQEIADELGLDIKKNRREIRRKLWDRVDKKDYDIVVKEIKEDDFIVRTNHGEFIKDAGYIKTDGHHYESSVKRRKYMEDAIRKLKTVTHPFQILTVMKNMGDEKIDKDPQFRPLRVPPPDYDFEKDEPVYFTGAIVMATPTGQLYMIPVDCTFEDYKVSRLTKERDVYFVLLPKNLPLFENKQLFNEGKFIMEKKEKQLMEKYLVNEFSLFGKKEEPGMSQKAQDMIKKIIAAHTADKVNKIIDEINKNPHQFTPKELKEIQKVAARVVGDENKRKEF